jgi:hypothetical protein
MDSSILLESLQNIQHQFLGHVARLPKDEMIDIVLEVATVEYRPILSIERRIRGEHLIVEDLEFAMGESYRQLNRNIVKRNESESWELLLYQFTGICYICGKSGHQANECKRKNKKI